MEKKKPITCPLNFHQDYIGNRDLDWYLHKGFTIGRGKQMYWMIIWHPSSGNATVFTNDDKPIRRRYVRGDIEITIHFLD